MPGKVFLRIAFFICVCGGVATAHPLGNFTVNQYSRLEINNSNIKVRAVLDMAEIPTLQESPAIDTNRNGTLSAEELDAYAEKITDLYLADLFLTVNGSLIELRPLAKNISLPAGAGNLPTLRIEWDFVREVGNLKPDAVNRVYFENRNNRDRLGWNEIIVTSAGGAVKVFDSTAFGSGVTEELKTYPQESLSSPLAERVAEFSFTSGSLPDSVRALQNRDGQKSTPIEKDKFAELINVPKITLPIVLAGLFLAFGFGAMHALSPGHGKTVVGAYLVGSRGTFKHAVFLGLTVTITHTLGVFALGFVTLFAANYILPERLLPLLNFVSGLLVLFIGLSLFKDRLFGVLGWKDTAHHHDDNTEPHSHTGDEGNFHEHSHSGLTHTHGGSTHTHLPPANITWRSLLALGISGGLLPCPSALVLMLSAISLGRVGYGLILTLVFSFGLAATLTSVGIIFLYIGKFFDSPSLNNNRLIKTLPVFSALVIACLGAAICYGSLK